jgi:cysteinyl-tRNA synthetase
MSEALLGETIDIHGGGHDLIFPHHENEIAQSECAHGRPFVLCWVHNGYLVVNGEKMSKSLGNFLTVRDLLARARGEAIRLLLLKTHYRQPLDFTEEGLRQAKGELDRFYTALRGAAELAPADGEMPAGVMDALEDDLNTPLAVAYLHEMARDLNSERDPARRARFKANLLNGGHLLGLLNSTPSEWFNWLPTSPGSIKMEEVEDLVRKMDDARKQKDYKTADEIRSRLRDQNVSVSSGGAAFSFWQYSDKK